VILITGGLGFIGSHTARVLLDLGQSCLLTQHRASSLPGFLTDDAGTRALVEQLDCTDRAAFLQLGECHQITGIVHLAAPSPGRDVIASIDAHMQGLLNALHAAARWSVQRISIASTLGVYLGVNEIPFREDAPLPMTPIDPIPVLKKSAELIGSLVADSGVEVVNLRISTVWGPLRPHNEPPFAALPALVRTGAPSHQPRPYRGRARRLLRQGRRLRDRAPAGRRPPQPPHLQRGRRPRHQQRRGRRGDQVRAARRTRRPAAGP